jgi:hypothetical protein
MPPLRKMFNIMPNLRISGPHVKKLKKTKTNSKKHFFVSN